MARALLVVVVVVSHLLTSSSTALGGLLPNNAAVNTQVNVGAVNVQVNAGVVSSTNTAGRNAVSAGANAAVTATPPPTVSASKPSAPPAAPSAVDSNATAAAAGATASPTITNGTPPAAVVDNATTAVDATAGSPPLVSPTNGTGSYRGMAREFLSGHNTVRARYGMPPMKWDHGLARLARRWSTAMRKDCVVRHSSAPGVGESVYVNFYGWDATAVDALRSWNAEEGLYDRSTGGCVAGRSYKDCGHFALMVGESSQRVGCGRAECFKGGVFITCNYSRD